MKKIDVSELKISQTLQSYDKIPKVWIYLSFVNFKYTVTQDIGCCSVKWELFYFQLT